MVLNILDIIEKQHSILDPKQVALSGGNMYRPGGLFQGGFFHTIMDLVYKGKTVKIHYDEESNTVYFDHLNEIDAGQRGQDVH